MKGMTKMGKMGSGSKKGGGKMKSRNTASNLSRRMKSAESMTKRSGKFKYAR